MRKRVADELTRIADRLAKIEAVRVQVRQEAAAVREEASAVHRRLEARLIQNAVMLEAPLKPATKPDKPAK